jgi:ubiquinol-cytochrome c reductase cytochrome b subunit
VPLGIIFTGAALWPFFEQWATGDKRFHHINDRPRNAPVRTGIGVAAVAFYGVLLAEGANDVIANAFDIPLYTVTWISRVAVFVLPIGGYFVTKRICLGLQRKDAELLTHGVEIGIIRQLPSGEFIEESRPLTAEERAVVDSKKEFQALPTPQEEDANGIPAPAARGPLGRARALANRAFTETIEISDGHGNGHGDGHGPAVEGGEHAAVGSSEEH